MTETGTTAVQVSPGQESEDMSKIRQVFDHALNSIVAATELASQVKELAAKVNALSRDVDNQRQRNAWLDEQLTSVRTTRDKALSDLSDTRSELATTKAMIEGLQTAKDNAEQVITGLKAELEHTRTNLEKAEITVMDLEDDLSKANGTISKAKEQLKSLFALVEPPKPEPKVEPVQEQPRPDPVQQGEAVAYNYPSDPGPQQAPSPVIEPWKHD